MCTLAVTAAPLRALDEKYVQGHPTAPLHAALQAFNLASSSIDARRTQVESNGRTAHSHLSGAPAGTLSADLDSADSRGAVTLY